MISEPMTDDGESVVSSGRANAIAELQAMAELGVANITSSAIAARGERLTPQSRPRSGRADRAGSYDVELLRVIEIDVDGQIAAVVTFDIDDIDAAFEELDARYLAGEAATHAHTWSVITPGLCRTQSTRNACDGAQLRSIDRSIACRDRVG